MNFIEKWVFTGPRGPIGVSGPSGDLLSFATRTLAQLADLSDGDFVRTSGFSTAADGGGALYRKVQSQPSHPGKFQSIDGSWWEIAETVIHAKMLGCKIDYVFDGDVDDATDDTDAVNDWFETLQVLHRSGTWEGLIVLTAPLDPITRAITIDGHNKATSGFILRGDFSDFAIKQLDTFGNWNATVDPNTTPPPGPTYKSFIYRNFTVWGAGENYSQRGMVFEGRCDVVCMEHVQFMNINGIGLWLGRAYSGAANKGYVGESSFNDVRVWRCGKNADFTLVGVTLKTPAFILEGAGVSAGINQNHFMDFDVSLPRGVGMFLYASGSQCNRNDFYGLKLHGTGESGIYPAPFSTELLVVQGRVNNLRLYGLDLNGQGDAYYAINFRKHPTSGNPLDVPNSVYIHASHIVSTNIFNIEQGQDIKIMMDTMTCLGTTLKVGPDVAAGIIEYHQTSGQTPVLDIDPLAVNVFDHYAPWPELSSGGATVQVNRVKIRYFFGDHPDGSLVGTVGDICICQKGDAALNSDNLWVKHTGTGVNTGWKPLQMILFGTTAQRPQEPTPYQMYIDVTLGKPIWYVTTGGARWIDAAGTTV